MMIVITIDVRLHRLLSVIVSHCHCVESASTFASADIVGSICRPSVLSASLIRSSHTNREDIY